MVLQACGAAGGVEMPARVSRDFPLGSHTPKDCRHEPCASIAHAHLYKPKLWQGELYINENLILPSSRHIPHAFSSLSMLHRSVLVFDVRFGEVTDR